MSGALTEIHKLPGRYYEDQEWALAHYDRWMEVYPDQWIAVISRQVVAAGVDLEEVWTRAHEKTGVIHHAPNLSRICYLLDENTPYAIRDPCC